MEPIYDMRSGPSRPITNCGVDANYDSVQSSGVLTKGELLAALDAKGIKNSEIQKVLDLPSSRVSEIRKKDGKPRELTYDEGAKLVRAFLPELDQQVSPLPPSILRLIVLHVARKLGRALREEQVADLAEDLRVFSEFAADPKVRGSVEAAEAFFRALELRHPSPEEAAPQGTDRDSSR